MRKAFDANVSRAKPRLRLGSLTSTGVIDPAQEALAHPAQQALAMVEHATAQANGHDAAALEAPPPAPVAAAASVQEKITAHLAQTVEAPQALQASLVPPPAVVEETVEAPQRQRIMEAKVQEPPAPVVVDSKERREKLKERLKAATAKVEPSQPTPQSPAEARTSALSLIAQLRQQLEDSQRLTAALAKDLDQTRSELGRAAEEARARTSEATRMSEEVAQRAKLIEELGKEMASLEGERDDTLVQLQSARANLEQQVAAKKDLEGRLAAREAELAETLTEEERLAAELENRNAELRQAQQAIAGLSEEREKLSKQVSELTRERTDLLDSQKALDEIHRALAEARVRVGAR
ncbi:MAG TPA: hypothetical protein VGK67_39990 [Myxococcales bacterium]|jgi:DNA repair exonuclease SbcCD ATPase subunit